MSTKQILAIKAGRTEALDGIYRFNLDRRIEILTARYVNGEFTIWVAVPHGIADPAPISRAARMYSSSCLDPPRSVANSFSPSPPSRRVAAAAASVWFLAFASLSANSTND